MFADSEDAQAVAAEALALGATAYLEIPGAPWVIVGEVAARGFFLHERGGGWRVAISPDDMPDVDPWALNTTDIIALKTGTLAELLDEDGVFSATRAVHVAVAAVRAFLRQRDCEHPHGADDRYCSRCGVALVDPALP
jgi:hypothetical protein